MNEIHKLKSYNSLRKLVTPESFNLTMNYLVWHNRQQMTPMLPVWQALIVAYAMENYIIDATKYPKVKSFFEQLETDVPASFDKCRTLAGMLEDLVISDR